MDKPNTKNGFSNGISSLFWRSLSHIKTNYIAKSVVSGWFIHFFFIYISGYLRKCEYVCVRIHESMYVCVLCMYESLYVCTYVCILNLIFCEKCSVFTFIHKIVFLKVSIKTVTFKNRLVGWLVGFLFSVVCVCVFFQMSTLAESFKPGIIFVRFPATYDINNRSNSNIKRQ